MPWWLEANANRALAFWSTLSERSEDRTHAFFHVLNLSSFASFLNNIAYSCCSDFRSKLPYSFANLTHILISPTLSLSPTLALWLTLSFSLFLTPTSHFLLSSQGVMGSDNTAFAEERKLDKKKRTEQSCNPAKQTIKLHMARLNSVKIVG